MEISVEMTVAGRDLSEPRLSPDGRWVAFVTRWGNATAIVSVPIVGGPERIVTAGPAPAAGRGLGGGCFDWLPDGSALVYAARDGDLWLQPFPGGVAHRITEVGEGRRLEAPAVAPDGEPWLRRSTRRRCGRSVCSRTRRRVAWTTGPPTSCSIRTFRSHTASGLHDCSRTLQ